MCKSKKLTDSLDSLIAYVDKGAPDGHILQFKDQADEYINVRPGTVNIKITQIPHPLFTRKDNDLSMSLDITLKQALLGFTKYVKHLDGHTVTIDRAD